MRFCMVTTFYPPYHFGGDATYVRALARGLVARDHAVEVVHCTDAYRLCANRRPALTEGEEDDVVVHGLKSRVGPLSPLFTQQTGRPAFKRRALDAILGRDFDVVHFHNVSLVGGPAVLRLSRARVTLYSLHEHWLLCPTHVFWKNNDHACERPTCLSCCLRSGIPPQLWRYTGMARRAVGTVDALLAPSEYTARRHREAGFGPPIHVLPLFSTLTPGQTAPARAVGRPRFLYVGRVTASKGVERLTRAFADLPEYDLDVVGDGDARAELERRSGDRSNIRFLGAVPQARLPALYQQANALILPSLAPETFGLAVVEAFACGTPAIVHDAGGAREVVDATGAGFVYRTPEELRSAVRRLAEDAELRLRLSARARSGYARLYSEERHVGRYLDHIDAIGARKRATAH